MNDAKRLPAKRVIQRFGVSHMTLHRWCRDEKLSFPQPFYVNGRRFWREEDLIEFEIRQQAAGAPAPAKSANSPAAA